MNRKQLIEKYKGTLLAMFNAGEKGDNNVLLDKLGYMVKKYAGIPVGEDDNYKGIPDGFNWDQACEDFKGLWEAE